MLNASILAGVFGPLLVILGLWNLCCRAAVKRLGDSLQKTPAALFCWVLLNLLLGLTIVNINPFWYWDLTLLLTILGWLLIIRGLLVLYIPSAMKRVVDCHFKGSVITGLVTVIWGLALCHLAFNYFS